MALRTVLVNAFTLLRQHPRVFIPRLVMTAVWSIYWIVLIEALQNPHAVTLQHIFALSLTIMVIAPIQIWVYNAYFVMVQQHKDETLYLRDAFRAGLKKLPQSLAVFALLSTMALVFGMPGALIYLYGVTAGIPLLQSAGLALSGVAILAVMIITYFTPVSVVIGDKSFFENVKEGLLASHEERREVMLLTLLSFGSLFLTQLMRGGFEVLGAVGFFTGRFIAAVMGVYFLIVNPELFLHAKQSGEE